MHMLMRHGIIRRERWVKDAHPLRHRTPRFGSRRNEDAGRQHQRNEPPPQNLTARFLAIDLEDHLPAVRPQKAPCGRHQTSHPSSRLVIPPV